MRYRDNLGAVRYDGLASAMLTMDLMSELGAN